MRKMIWFDMDGTIADLYGVMNWLEFLCAENTLPYVQASVMINMSQLAKLLHKLQAIDYGIGIISWTSKNGSFKYNHEVSLAKRAWLNKHLPSVQWDEIQIIDYGTHKATVAHTTEDILFDDEEKNRYDWVGKAYKPDEIVKVLKELIHGA